MAQESYLELHRRLAKAVHHDAGETGDRLVADADQFVGQLMLLTAVHRWRLLTDYFAIPTPLTITASHALTLVQGAGVYREETLTLIQPFVDTQEEGMQTAEASSSSEVSSSDTSSSHASDEMSIDAPAESTGSISEFMATEGKVDSDEGIPQSKSEPVRKQRDVLTIHCGPYRPTAAYHFRPRLDSPFF
jgi:hypothetical protein